MADRGQITGGVIDGPLAFDNAISPEAARIKGIKSPVAGQAQILIVPDLEAGNILAKQLTFLANAEAAGIVLGVAEMVTGILSTFIQDLEIPPWIGFGLIVFGLMRVMPGDALTALMGESGPSMGMDRSAGR